MYTTNQVAAGFRVSRTTINTWVESGKLVVSATANLRGDRRFAPEDIEQFAREHKLIFIAPTTEVDN